jgi:prolyl-tRNA synthetase
VPRAEFVASIVTTLQSIQDNLFARARDLREQHTRRIDSKEEFYAWVTPPKVPENAPTPIHGGFALTHFNGDVKLEQRIKNDLGVTVRCIPLDKSEPGTCPFSGQPSPQRVVWAKAY